MWSVLMLNFHLKKKAVKLRILTLLRERGQLSIADIQLFSGFNRTRVYRLVKDLKEISEKVGFSPLRIFFSTATRSASLKIHRFFGRFAPRSLLPEKIYSRSKPTFQLFQRSPKVREK